MVFLADNIRLFSASSSFIMMPKRPLLLKRLEWTHRLGIGKNLAIGTSMIVGKAMEASVYVDIVYNNGAAGRQGSPCPIHLKSNVSFTMKAVVNKKINLSNFRKQFG